MRVTRLLASAVSVLALHPLPVFAQSQYALSGSFARNFGTLLHLPVVGSTPCNLTIMSGPGGAVVPAYTTPHSRTMTRGVNVQTDGMGATVLSLGCIGAAPGAVVTTTGAGVGGAFEMPVNAFSRPLPGSPAWISFKYAPPLIQVQTSLAFAGPPASAATPPTGFRQFRADAWTSQTGRASADFTWCLGDPNCAGISQATQPAIIKVTAGPNRFGGTMSAVVAAGPEPSRLVIAAGLGAVSFAPIATPGSRPTGRGYAAVRHDPAVSGSAWAMYMASAGGRITMGTTYLGPRPGSDRTAYGFPFTTGRVVVRNTGTHVGNPAITTLSAHGGDTVTPGGVRNISLVAGSLVRFSGAGTAPQVGINQIALPEPGAASRLLAGAVALLAIALVRARRPRT